MACLALALVAGCGGDDGDGDGDTGPQPDAAVATPTLELAVDVPKIRVRQGETLELPIEVTRGGSFDGAVSVTVSGLPEGASTEPLTLAAGETAGTVAVTATASAPHAGPVAVTITATSEDDSTLVDSVELPGYLAGAPGEPDESFSFDGTLDYTPTIADLAFVSLDDCIQLTSGHLVLAGSTNALGNIHRVYLANFQPDGTLDESFGSDGSILGVEGDESADGSLLADPGGGFYAAFGTKSGGADSYTRLVRKYMADGTIDQSFSDDGTAVQPVNLRQLADDKLLVSPLGLLDAQTGEPIPSFEPAMLTNAPDVGYRSAAVDSEGRIASSLASVEGYPFQIARLTPSGTLDSSFGAFGIASVQTAIGTKGKLLEVTRLGPDGSVFAAGYAVGADDSTLSGYIVKVDQDGDPDNNFGTGGRLLVEANGIVTDLHVAPSGKLLALQIDTTDEDAAVFRLVRYQPDGAPDTSFGTDGEVILAIEGQTTLLVDPDGERAVIAGDKPDELPVRVIRLWL